MEEKRKRCFPDSAYMFCSRNKISTKTQGRFPSIMIWHRTLYAGIF